MFFTPLTFLDCNTAYGVFTIVSILCYLFMTLIIPMRASKKSSVPSLLMYNVFMLPVNLYISSSQETTNLGIYSLYNVRTAKNLPCNFYFYVYRRLERLER
jgi:hypothetical protein